VERKERGCLSLADEGAVTLDQVDVACVSAAADASEVKGPVQGG
jgi:hypothetical protein